MKKIIVSLFVLSLIIGGSTAWARGPGGGGKGGRGTGGAGWRRQCPNPPCQQLGESQQRKHKLIRKRQRVHQPQNVPPSDQSTTQPPAGAPQ